MLRVKLEIEHEGVLVEDVYENVTALDISHQGVVVLHNDGTTTLVTMQDLDVGKVRCLIAEPAGQTMGRA